MTRVSHVIDRIDVTFDDPNLVSNAGLLLVATLTQRLGTAMVPMPLLIGTQGPNPCMLVKATPQGSLCEIPGGARAVLDP